MGLFGRFRKGQRTTASYDRPAWMKDGMEAALYGGPDDLEVVGESYYQDELWTVAGGYSQERVRREVAALLVPEPDNEYDANAVAIWVDGFKVGHLSRDDAARLRPGLVALELQRGKKIALEGVVVGGGQRQDGIGNLGVFLKYDPTDFGLAPSRTAQPASSLRTGLSGAFVTDEEDDSYDLTWMETLPTDNISAIGKLRDLLAQDPDPIDRHYVYAELERRLYKARNAFASALDEYDQVCRDHDAEMDGIRAALFTKFDEVPLLETYKQQAIRQSKAGDFAQGLRWVERGLDLYDKDAARQEWVDDLRKRKDRLQRQVDSTQ